MGVTPDQLLVHDAFVRGVARAILGRDSEIDDVVQETWVSALDAPPNDAGALRGWLRVVVRNLSLRAIRRRIRARAGSGSARRGSGSIRRTTSWPAKRSASACSAR